MPSHTDPIEPQPPAAWRHFAETDDIDEHARIQRDWTLRYEQLSSGAFRGAVRHVQLPGLRLVHETSSTAAHQRGTLGADNFGFAMAIELQGEAIFNGQRIDGQSIMLGCGDDLDLTTPAGFALIGAVVNREILEPLWQHMYQKPLPGWLDAQFVVQASAPAATAVRELHLRALAALADPAFDERSLIALRDSVLIEWIEALPGAVHAPDLKSVAARRRVVDRACELMLSRSVEPPSILEICQRIGASPRKLNYCFQDVLGVSPAKYLRAVRLNNARRDLKDPVGQTSVQDVAARWGFWHLGQFSVDYRRQFGELPSATLRTARARA
jgi:AraC family transcriptional regulator, ethanolamine operon transcriptional activator